MAYCSPIPKKLCGACKPNPTSFRSGGKRGCCSCSRGGSQTVHRVAPKDCIILYYINGEPHHQAVRKGYKIPDGCTIVSEAYFEDIFSPIRETSRNNKKHSIHQANNGFGASIISSISGDSVYEIKLIKFNDDDDNKWLVVDTKDKVVQKRLEMKKDDLSSVLNYIQDLGDISKEEIIEFINKTDEGELESPWYREFEEQATRAYNPDYMYPL